MERPGILAIWNDRDEGIGDFYEDWYVHQHLLERVGLPGWRFGRRYELIDAGSPTDNEPRFFSYYEMDSVDAMYSDAYMARLNDPTPETVKIMQHWRNMTRTSCVLHTRTAPFYGAYVVAARFAEAVDAAALSDIAEKAMERNSQLAGVGAPLPRAQILAAQAWINETPKTPDTAESGVRAEPDQQIQAAIVLDCMREGDAAAAREWLIESSADLSPILVTSYRFLCEYRP